MRLVSNDSCKRSAGIGGNRFPKKGGIVAGRALQRVRQWAEEKNPVVQLMLPMVEILTLAKRGAGELVREAGLRMILLAIAQKAEALTGAPTNNSQVARRIPGVMRHCDGRNAV